MATIRSEPAKPPAIWGMSVNMVEIEIGVLRSQCLDRRIGERDQLVSEIDAWVRARNASGARINWMFDTQRARKKLARAYPVTSNQS